MIDVVRYDGLLDDLVGAKHSDNNLLLKP